MAAKAATSTNKTRKPRTEVKLPDTVSSDSNVAWPGSNRGRTASPLKAQLQEEIGAMTLNSVRRYEIVGDAEQKSFVNLFRKVADEVHGKLYGVQSVVQGNSVFVRLGNRRASK